MSNLRERCKHEKYGLLDLIFELEERLERIDERFERLLEALGKKRIAGFTIKLQGDNMLSIIPGNSPVFTATPVPATSAPSTPPTWESSDTVNAPITVGSTGLVATVEIPATAVVGAGFTLTVSYTNSDGTLATPQTNSFTTVAPASPDITGFTPIVQSA